MFDYAPHYEPMKYKDILKQVKIEHTKKHTSPHDNDKKQENSSINITKPQTSTNYLWLKCSLLFKRN